MSKEIGLETNNYYDGSKRFYDKAMDMTVVKIFSGDYFVTDKPKHVLMTILGSCVAACVRDPVANVGGMNHFLLPGTEKDESARFGAYAMEVLINDILKKGGRKDRLEVKLFGGGNVINNSAMIGNKNADFAIDFIKKEGLSIAKTDLKGTSPRRVHYYPDTGKVMVRKIGEKEEKELIKEETTYEKSLVAHKKEEGDVELF